MSGSTIPISIRVACSQAGPAAARLDAPEFVTTQNGNLTWTLRADLADALLPRLRRVVEHAESDATVETVKTGPHRTVYRLSGRSDEFYLKHFRNYHWKGLLLNLVRPTKAEIEWRAALRIARLGLPTFEPVALGLVRQKGLVADSFLVSRGIPNAIPLDEFVTVTLLGLPDSAGSAASACRQSELRRLLVESVGELCARLHRTGVEHADFHAANILVRLEPDGKPRLWLIDLHRVHFRRRLSPDRRFRNLAFLHQFFACHSTRTDRLRFYRAYQRIWRGRGESWLGTRETDLPPRTRAADLADIAEIERHLAEGAERGWQRADRAWRRGNRHVRNLDNSGGCCRGVVALNANWLKTVRDEPERLFLDPTLVWHKQTAKHRIAEVSLNDGVVAPHGRAFLKCMQRPGLWRNWLDRFRDSPVRKAWEFGHALLRRQIDTPRPILCVERISAQPRRYYLLTESVPETSTVSAFLQRDWQNLPAEDRRAWLAAHGRRLAVQLRRLHNSGFDHRDLKFSNLLVSSRLEDPRVWFLDLDGMRTWVSIPESRSIQNLARINVSAGAHSLGNRADRLRFLKWYLGTTPCHVWKSWWRRIDQSSHRKLTTNHRRGRAIQ